MKISQLMTKTVRTCLSSDTLEQAARLMWDHDVGVVPVVDETGQVVGMVTDRDACMAALTQARPLHALTVAVAMSKHVVTCRPEDTAEEISKLMSKNKIRRIPVVDDAQRPIGIVSLSDLAIAMSKGKGRDVPAAEVAGTLAAICGAPVATA
ncbi:MAG: CBS domain-containing protein [Deltaproteobacteria bacterium]|nr:CBS domain-containing protein [Deltaproteobacteria bacterium]